MRCVFLLFDSLNRHAVPPYGDRPSLKNFSALATRSAVFDKHFVGSMPCIPARREIHTGRLNFLHRGWGPLEPFDVSFADVLRNNNIYSHLITDHYHYFEDGGFGYHGRYDSYEFIRGQEKDKWRSMIVPGLGDYQEQFAERQRDMSLDPNSKASYYANHRALTESGAFPLSQCFDRAVDFLDEHAAVDNWFLHLECFDPHEPFFVGDEDPAGADPAQLGGKIFDWPAYGRNDLPEGDLAALLTRYERLVQRCDHELGRLMDTMTRLGMWDDTVLIVSTDHGLLLGEKDFLGKNRPPFFNEVAQIPLMIAAPPSLMPAPRRVPGLTQTIDLMPTFLDIFDITPQQTVAGRSLLPAVAGSADATHEGVLFGQFGAALNYTDGVSTVFLYPDAGHDALFQYTLMPTHMRTFFQDIEFEGAALVADVPYACGFPVLRLPMQQAARANMVARYPLLDATDALYDLPSDPLQEHPLDDPGRMARCRAEIARLLEHHAAPREIYARFALEAPAC
ncbi:MAG: sulfatase-like hydrolase/transferase [Acuticoccus sp.]